MGESPCQNLRGDGSWLCGLVRGRNQPLCNACDMRGWMGLGHEGPYKWRQITYIMGQQPFLSHGSEQLGLGLMPAGWLRWHVSDGGFLCTPTKSMQLGAVLVPLGPCSWKLCQCYYCFSLSPSLSPSALPSPALVVMQSQGMAQSPSPLPPFPLPSLYRFTELPCGWPWVPINLPQVTQVP